MRISTLVKICAHQHFSVDEALLLVRTLVDLAKENKNPIPTSNLEYTMEMTREFARSNIEADPRVIYTFFDACSSIQRGDAQLGR